VLGQGLSQPVFAAHVVYAKRHDQRSSAFDARNTPVLAPPVKDGAPLSIKVRAGLCGFLGCGLLAYTTR